jgi:hypothetical protein
VRNSRICRLYNLTEKVRTPTPIRDLLPYYPTYNCLVRDTLCLYRQGIISIKSGRGEKSDIVSLEKIVSPEDLQRLFPPKKNHEEEYPADDRLERSFYGEDN